MSSLSSSLDHQLRTLAVEQGFSQIGIAPAVTPTGFHRLLDWLSKGYAADMQWMERRAEAYRHPDSMLPTTRSVIMLAINYRDGSVRKDGPKIARYAWGTADYHDVLKERARPLVSLIKQHHPAAKCRIVVDTAPLLERDFGRLAGLGWFGKNTMLISRKIGSWFVLAAILTDIELQYDTAEESSYCGTCTRCLEACPTHAFPEPGVLDAGRCISYLTIEQRTEPIPESLRTAIGDWMFGCDICQDVCPWNRFAPTETVEEFQALTQRNTVDGPALFRMAATEFEQQFAGTPLSRPGRAGLLRNLAIVLGNLKATNAEPELVMALSDPEALVRGAAAWALAKMGATSAFLTLQQRLLDETDDVVRMELRSAIAILSAKQQSNSSATHGDGNRATSDSNQKAENS